MQSTIERSQELGRELAIRTRIAMGNVAHAISERSREQRGQTAAEYMGILLIVALIIGALVSLDVDGKIKTAVGDFIDNIKNGDKTD